MSEPVIIDVETQMTFREAQTSDPGKLKISVAGLFDYGTNKYYCFAEHEITQLFPFLENASQIIGFNIVHFDMPAINAYYIGKLSKLPTLDLMDHVEKHLGFRVSLDDLVRETLGTPKQGHGLLAIEYFKNGEMEKLKKYCLSDVKLTRELYEYGKKHGKVFCKTATGRREIIVDWNQASHESASVDLTLPW